MSIDLPANVERELELYAQSEHISTAEAASKIIMDALRVKGRKAKSSAQSSDWATFQKLVPGFDVFQQLPEGTVDEIIKSSRRVRAEKLTPRA